MDMIDSDQRVSTGRIITENQKGSIPFLAKLLVSVWSTDWRSGMVDSWFYLQIEKEIP